MTVSSATDWWAKMNDVVEGGEESNQDTRDMVRSQNDLYMVVNNNGAEVNSNNDNTEESVKEESLLLENFREQQLIFVTLFFQHLLLKEN